MARVLLGCNPGGWWRTRGQPPRPREALKVRSAATDSQVAGGERSQSLLIVSPVWPEYGSSAAGVRTSGIIRAFQSAGWRVSYACPATPNSYTDELPSLGVAALPVPMNREGAIRSAVAGCAPDAVVFDRFLAEEAFSFHVRAERPSASRVVDTQDLHFLRAARQEAAQRSKGAGGDLTAAMAALPGASYAPLQRELASIHRSDLAIVCSPVEERLLVEHYGVPREKVVLSSFYYPPPRDLSALPGFAGRRHFMTVGNFRHPPNEDAVRWLATELWPRIRAELPDAEMHVYGAYPSNKHYQLHDEKNGFHVLGPVDSLDVMEGYRLCLAPLRYGAGIKGKVLDAWDHGLPVVTTPIGAEGMMDDPPLLHELLPSSDPAQQARASQPGADASASPASPASEPPPGCGGGYGRAWGGRWGAMDGDAFVRDAVELYTREGEWEAAQAEGARLLGSLFGARGNGARLVEAVGRGCVGAPLAERRERDFTQAVLWQTGNRATEFFSRWVELKETTAEAAAAAAEANEKEKKGSGAGGEDG